MRTRLERAEDKRDDIEYDIDKWGFSYTPSEMRRRERRLAKAQAKVDRLAVSSEGSAS